MEHLEYVGVTGLEAAMIRTLIYQALKMQVMLGPNEQMYEMTDTGMDLLRGIGAKFEMIDPRA